MTQLVTVVVADDHALVRRALVAMLDQTPDMRVLADADTTDAAIAAAIQGQPDVVVLDIDIPGVDSFAAARTIREHCPKTKVIFLSAFPNDQYIQAALDAGAMGYLTKNEPPEIVARAVKMVAQGQAYFSPDVQSRLVIDTEGVSLSHEAVTRGSTLTTRELEVLRYIARGLSKKEMAQAMSLSVKTVENHTQHVMKRLNIHDRVELARYAIREGISQA